MFTLKLVAAAGLIAYASAQATCSAPDNQDICAIEGAMGGSRVVPNVVREFTPTGVMQVHYDGIIIGGAQQLTPTRSANAPGLQFNATEARSGPTYLFMMFDPDAGDNASVLHYMLTNCQVNDNTLYLEACTAVAPYGGPAPPQGTGEHRYIQLLFTQPDGFVQPSYPETIGGTRLGWSYDDFLATNGLDGPVGGMFFKSQFDATTPVPAGSGSDPNTAGGSPTNTAVVVSGRTAEDAPSTTAAAAATTTSRAARSSAAVTTSTSLAAAGGSRNQATVSVASSTSGAEGLIKSSVLGVASIAVGLWALL